MHGLGPQELIVAFILAVMLFGRKTLRKLAAGINNFRGGPPTAMHPSPSDDGALLQRRSRKTEN